MALFRRSEKAKAGETHAPNEQGRLQALNVRKNDGGKMNSLQSHIKSCSLCQSKGCFACPEATALILYEAGAKPVHDALPADFQHIQVQHIAPLREITRWRNN